MTHKKRIAICISGQVRTSGEKLKEIAEKAREVDADVFISVWKEPGGKTFDSGPKHIAFVRIFGGEIAQLFSKDWIFNFQNTFPFWKSILPVKQPLSKSVLENIFHGAIVEVEDDLPDIDMPHEINTLRMLYKIHKCNLLKKNQEKLQGFAYDRVIRVRPDMLIDFKSLVEPELSENDLLVFFRRGRSLHDKYWAGSSKTDDKLAGLYEYCIENKMDSWKGIHRELTEYIDHCGINPVDMRSTLVDFGLFGSYTTEEKRDIIDRFNAALAEKSRPALAGFSPEYEQIASEILQKASDLIYRDIPLQPDFAIVEALEKLLENASVPDNGGSLFPAVSLAFACSPDIPLEDRAMLAFCVLLDDALTWKVWLGYRAHNVATLLSECGTELLPYFKDTTQMIELSASGSVARRLLALWRLRWTAFEESTMLQAQKDVSHAFLSHRENRLKLFNFLAAEKRPQELLSFAELLLEKFPDQKNVGVMLAQAKNFVASLERDDS